MCNEIEYAMIMEYMQKMKQKKVEKPIQVIANQNKKITPKK